MDLADTFPDFAAEREAMVVRQIEGRGIRDPNILEAFRQVPRESFVAEEHSHIAYQDHPLPIEAGQTISQPYIVALMIDAAGIKPGDRVLEVGAGSGYAAAVIGHIAAQVIAIERHSELAEIAARRINELGMANVRIVAGDGTLGSPDDAPFDAVLVAASGIGLPSALLDQLAPGGCLVMPVGEAGGIQNLVRARKKQDGTIEQDVLCAVRFVPLIGEGGWTG